MGKDNYIQQGNQITVSGNVENAETDIAETMQKAEASHDEYIQQMLEAAEIGEGQEVSFPYLVRGAQLWCTCGTHKRKLNLPLCHGAYIGTQPLVHEEDCQVGDDQNIAAFGICESEEHPSKKSWWEKAISVVTKGVVNHCIEEEDKKIILQKEDGTNVKGYACTPCIVSTWKDVHKSEKIARNGTDGKAEGDQLSALTVESFLVCAYGGLIQPLTSGQEEEV